MCSGAALCNKYSVKKTASLLFYVTRTKRDIHGFECS